MKGILWYVTRKLEGIFDRILMEFHMRISEDKIQIKKSMYIPRFLSSGLYGSRQYKEVELRRQTPQNIYLERSNIQVSRITLVALLVPPLFIERNSHSYNQTNFVFARATVPY